MKLFFPFLFITFLWCMGCTPEKSQTFLGGEIINPNENFITLSKDDRVIDTVFLDEENRFSYSFEKAEEGLYTFRHPPENQTFYIEEGDSLLLRVNTVEFDESLMYSADGAKENNFLMEMYLLNEKNNDLIYSYYKINPKTFSHKTDSIKEVREKRLQALNKKFDFSEDFTVLASKSIDYEYYDLRERYAFLINKYFKNHSQTIPDDFFDYRKKVNFNDKSLQSHYVYQRFLDNYLRNRSIENCVKKPSERECFSLNNTKNLERRLILADSIFTIKCLKNRFLRRFASRKIIFSETEAEIDSTLQLLADFDYKDERFEELKNLAEVQRSYFIGNNISHKELIDHDLNTTTFESVSHKPVILYSWSVYSTTHHKNQHKKINLLRNRYPEIDFIGINIDDGKTDLWQKTLENFDYNKEFEYQLYNSGSKKELYRNYLNKILFINQAGEIVFGQIELNDPAFENYVVEFLNQ